MSTFDLREELEALLDISTYQIDNEHDVRSMSVREIDTLLQQAVTSIADDYSSIADGSIYDVYRSVLKNVDAVPAALIIQLLDSLASGFQFAIDATNADVDRLEQDDLSERKAVLDIYGFLLNWFVISADKVKGSGEDTSIAPKPRRGRGGRAAAAGRAAKAGKTEWNWIDYVEGTLALICKAFKMRSARLWGTTADRDTFVDCMTRPVYRIMENEIYMKVEGIRVQAYKAICLAVKQHGHGIGAQTTILQSLQYYEHLAEPMAELLSCLAKEFDHTQLGDEILREVAAKEFNSADNTGPKAFSRFLIRFVEISPRSVLKQLSLLLNQLDSEAYQMRNAIVEILWLLIKELDSVEDDSNLKQINRLFRRLYDRTMDTSSYVRARVFNAFARICEKGTLKRPYPKHRLKMAEYAYDALEDKTSTVRKSATTCLIRLIQTHPWAVMKEDGGLLSFRYFDTKYKQAQAQLEKESAKYDQMINPSGAEGEEEEETEDSSRPKKKRERRRAEDDSMDVDAENEDSASEADSIMDQSEEEEKEVEAEGGGESAPKRHKKRGKQKARRSGIPDSSNLSADQMAVLDLQHKAKKQASYLTGYYEDATFFASHVSKASAILLQLLGSKSKAEVLEAMEFFRIAYDHKIDNAVGGIKKMLHLIWSKDNSSTVEDGKELKGVRQRLLECYRNLYFDAIEGLTPREQVSRITKNMIELTYDTSLAELTSLEEMMRYMMEDNQIHHDIISKLWQVYGSPRPLPKQQRQGAIIILGMLALANTNVVRDKVDMMLEIGLGKWGKADLLLAKYTCVALQRLNGSAKKVKGSLMDNTIRYSMDNPIFKKLQEAIETPCRSRDWFAFSEQAINTVYALGDHPEELANTLIKNLTRRAFTSVAQVPRPSPAPPSSSAARPTSATPAPAADADPMDEDTPAIEPTQDSEETPVPSSSATPASESQAPIDEAGDAFQLAQLLFVVGHVAIKHIVHLELIERECKRQKQETELGGHSFVTEKQVEGSGDTTAKNEDDIDQVAGNAEDEIGERIHAVRETELLYGEKSLLAIYGNLLIKICGQPHKYKDPTLRAAATLAFSKFLCVSSKFCDENHMLLFRLLETSKDANIRSNIVIALGDVAVSFSTIIDESLNQLYRGLTDENLIVKKNTLMVLTHLILNGMIKVKGQLGEMAKCLEDEERRVSDLAKLFFTELSGKDNAIYNNLPDVISHLSVGEHAMDEEAFQNTMRYIFTFIEKEKQAENIVEKLCQRFRTAEAARHWRDIAFCLSLLPFRSERSLKKLIEGLPSYRDKLHDEGVYARFQEILSKTKGTKSGKLDANIHEFEKILDEHRQKGEDEQALEKRVETKKAQAKKRATRRNARTKKQPTPIAEEAE
ncbi:non-SMC mitotic condensation complex subunit 1-domain-containing protein [Vararia minispora EC-137]|uniref:Non-SMC mitotic condensation complex subunit 1-domain-containing protein n=1 Tax=Vararia minispora EC-137 TaxID=1314806 RepID=A0ACB8QFN7_9AGAM|nr:non-SMC mitotic condensation complex subunit 1-domain-containing protein [Vararia minispora EC-137]